MSKNQNSRCIEYSKIESYYWHTEKIIMRSSQMYFSTYIFIHLVQHNFLQVPINNATLKF